jgi:hypothetical protein
MERIGMHLHHMATLDDDGILFEAVVYTMTAAERV